MTFPHWSRVTLYTSPCGFAECCVFVKQSHGPVHCAPARAGDPFFRSYGAGLPSSLTRFLSRASVLRYLPTCVGFGTVPGSVPRGFSGRRGSGGLREASFPLVAALRLRARRICLPRAPRRKGCVHLHPRLSFRAPRRSNPCRKLRNIHLMSIACALRPRLRTG